MINDRLSILATLINEEIDTLLNQWRQRVKLLPSAQNLDTSTLNDHIPSLIHELADALQAPDNPSVFQTFTEESPRIHGLQRLLSEFQIEEVVAEYNILRACIHDLADEHSVNLQGEPFHIINRVFDHAIGLAIQTYVNQQSRNRQARRQEYLAFVAHDLRTPLNAISTAGRVLGMMLSTQATGAADVDHLLKALNRNVKHLEQLIGKVIEENTNLDEETGVRLERRHFDLWPMVESIVLDLQPLIDKAGTQLINQVPDDLTVFADAGLLKRVLQNLIANAIRYTPQGIITVGAQRNEPEHRVDCWVADDGTGIEEDLLNKIFEKGETDPNTEDGEGLGLAIVKSFVEAHQGKVTVDSKIGFGSTFRFWLPDEAPPAQPRHA